MRLINEEPLIEYIENRYDITWKDDYEGGIKDACVDILEFIKNLPSAEPNILDDGTLTITVQYGMLNKVNRVIVDEVGTKFCKMMYQDALPSAERKGKWISYIDFDGYVECPFCGSTTNCESTEDAEILHYCWHCGARMVSE